MKHLIPAAAALALTSCVAYRVEPPEGTPPPNRLNPSDLEERLPTVTYEIVADSDANMFAPVVSEHLEARLLPPFRAAFVDVTASEPQPGIPHLDIYLRVSTEKPVLTFTFGLLSVCTLGLIPARDGRQYVFDLRIEQDAALLSQHRYEEELGVWASLFLLPVISKRDAGAVERELLDDFAARALFDAAATLR